jgi:hypothetical protein
MATIKKLTSYEIYNISLSHSEVMKDYVVSRDLYGSTSRSKKYRQTIFENLPIIVHVDYKYRNSQPEKVDFELIVFSNPEFIQCGYFMSKVIFNQGEVINHEMMRNNLQKTYSSGKIKSKSSFRIPQKYSQDKIKIIVTYHKKVETISTIDFDFFESPKENERNHIDSLSPISKSTLLNNSDVLEKLASPLSNSSPPAKRKHRSKSPNSSGWSFGESFIGEENPNIQPIGNEKKNPDPITNFLMEFQKKNELLQMKKEILEQEREMTTEELVNLLKIVLTENCEVSANMIVLAVKVSLDLKLLINSVF